MSENKPDNSSKVDESCIKKLRQNGVAQKISRQRSCSASSNVVRLSPATAMENVMAELSNRAKAARHERQVIPSVSGVTGWIQGTSDGDPVIFESSLERDFAYKALFDEHVVRVISQPETFSLDLGGTRANYTPDFLIEYMALTKQKISAYIEVKPNYRLNSSDQAYLLKLDAMSRYCRNRKHHRFFVVTEDDIHDQRLKNSRALFPLRFEPETFEDAREPIELVEDNPGIHFAEIVAQLAKTDAQKPFLVRSLRTLISTRDLWIDLNQEIRADLPVFNRRTKPAFPSFLEACVDWHDDPRREKLASLKNDDCSLSPIEAIDEMDLSDVSDANWERARERFEAIRKFANIERPDKGDLEHVQRQLKCSRATVYRLLQRYEMKPKVSSLLQKPRSGGKGKSRLPIEVEKIISEAIDRVFLTRQEVAPAEVIRQVGIQCRKANLKPPADNTVYARLDAIPEKEKVLKRRGYRAARNKFQPVGRAVYEPEYPLEVVQIDHTPVDIIIVDGVARKAIGRPYLTLAIDVATRVILGMHLSLEAPSSVSVGLCLTHATLPKSNWLRRRGINVDWPMYGKPQRIFVDNASEFRGKALAMGCEEHGISIEFRPLGDPRTGGIVERVIGSTMKRVHTLPGTTKSNPHERGDYNSDKNAVLTLAELESIIVEIIAEQYHETVHRSLMESPRRHYEKKVYGHASLEGCGLSKPIADERKFLIDFLPVTKRTLQRTGFRWDHIFYYDDALRPYLDRDLKGPFILRRDPRDLSKIFCLCPDTRTYIEIPDRDISREQRTLYEHRAIHAHKRREGEEAVDQERIDRSQERVRRNVESATSQTKRARRQAERKKQSERSSEVQPSFTPKKSRRKAKYLPEPGVTTYSVPETDDEFGDIDLWE